MCECVKKKPNNKNAPIKLLEHHFFASVQLQSLVSYLCFLELRAPGCITARENPEVSPPRVPALNRIVPPVWVCTRGVERSRWYDVLKCRSLSFLGCQLEDTGVGDNLCSTPSDFPSPSETPRGRSAIRQQRSGSRNPTVSTCQEAGRKENETKTARM